MTKTEKIARLMTLNNPFDGVIDGLVASLRRDAESMAGMSPERLKAVHAAIDKFAGKLRDLRDVREDGIVAAYEMLDENLIDAMLVLAGAPEAAQTFAQAILDAQNKWRDAALAESPDLMDLLYATSAEWAAANTEGEVAQSLVDLSEPPTTPSAA